MTSKMSYLSLSHRWIVPSNPEHKLHHQKSQRQIKIVLKLAKNVR